ncbi:MAG: hypothetical protein RLZZ292_2607 [Bacteroidota bacterium]|jgi:cyclophilin family peptidyl-prolyl cis-trans isomerase
MSNVEIKKKQRYTLNEAKLEKRTKKNTTQFYLTVKATPIHHNAQYTIFEYTGKKISILNVCWLYRF